MKNKILASFYNPMEKDLPVFFRQTVEGKGVLQNIKFTSKLQNFLLVNSSIMSFYLIPIFFLVAIMLGENNQQKVNAGIKYSFQISSGIIAYEIAKTLKMKAKKKSEIKYLAKQHLRNRPKTRIFGQILF